MYDGCFKINIKFKKNKNILCMYDRCFKIYFKLKIN